MGRLCESGKLPMNADRSIPIAAALDALLAFRGSAEFDRAAAGLEAAAVDAPPPARKAPAPPPTPPTAAELEEQERTRAAQAQVARVSLSIREQDLATKRGRAALLELELQQARGELVPIAEVVRDARAAGEVIRERLIALPSRMALVLEALCARQGGTPRATAIEAVLMDEINAVLDALHKTRFGERAEGERRTA